MADPRYDRPELSPSLTERQKVVLVRIMEEAAEVQQAAAKTLRWGLAWRSTSAFRC
jgi:phosphoribosyl-ATP pyrophosphohydrolase